MVSADRPRTSTTRLRPPRWLRTDTVWRIFRMSVRSLGTSVRSCWTRALRSARFGRGLTMNHHKDEHGGGSRTTSRRTDRHTSLGRICLCSCYLATTLIDLETPAVTPGPAWNTVGANGRISITSQPVRPTAVVSSPTPSVAARPPTNGASPSPAPAKVVTSVVKHEDTAANPSLDFLKWLTGSLKGLNQSVNRT